MGLSHISGTLPIGPSPRQGIPEDGSCLTEVRECSERSHSGQNAQVTEQAWRRLFVGLSKDPPLQKIQHFGWFLSFLGCLNAVPQILWLRQQEFISESWRSEVQRQAAHRLVALRAVRKNLLHTLLLTSGDFLANSVPPWLVHASLRHPSSLLHSILRSSHHLPSVQVCLRNQMPPFDKDTSHALLGNT